MTTDPFTRLAVAAELLARGGAALPDDLVALAETVGDAMAPYAAGAAITASGSEPRREMVREISVPARNRPRRSSSRVAPVLVASGSPDGSARFDSEAQLADALIAAAGNARGPGTDGERIHVASVDWSGAYEDGQPAVRGTSSAIDNGLALQHAADAHVAWMRGRGSLIASGGVTGPPEARYVIPTFGQVARPLRDALPSVLATRGELTYNMAPTIEDVLADQSGAMVGFVTNAQDVSGASKTVQEISAPTAKTVVVEAEVLRTQQGNFADRFTPEWTQAWMRNGQVRFARHAEARRFNDIATASTHMVDTPAHFGAWRDLKRCILGLTEELEDRLRDPDLPIRILMPEYVPAMCAADLTAQAPGDQAWDVTEDMVRARLNALDPNVHITFVFDGNQTGQRLLTTPSGQSPRTPGFDADVDFCVFPEGTWAYMDGGALDLGVVRDSVLSAQNKFQTFYEMWEAVAQLAPISYRVTISLCADGASQAPASIAVCSPQGS